MDNFGSWKWVNNVSMVKQTLRLFQTNAKVVSNVRSINCDGTAPQMLMRYGGVDAPRGARLSGYSREKLLLSARLLLSVAMTAC